MSICAYPLSERHARMIADSINAPRRAKDLEPVAFVVGYSNSWFVKHIQKRGRAQADYIEMIGYEQD